MSPIISAIELKSMSATDLVIADCRYDLANTRAGREAYTAGHIPGAVYVSLDDDLCAPISAHGGRHPLITVNEMAALFGKMGIERGVTNVVAYDDEGGCYAARLWWMLRYCGHERVRVLDGGYSAWLEEGGRSTSDVPEPSPAKFQPKVQTHMLAQMTDVRDRDTSELLVDVRAPERFTGAEEHLDIKAGHIPGAFNVPWRDFLTTDEGFVPVSRMADLLTGVDERSIVHCGSGVTGCVPLLAAEAAGLGTPRPYAGSWSDWITYPENPIEMGA